MGRSDADLDAIYQGHGARLVALPDCLTELPSVDGMSLLPAGAKFYVRHFQREVVCGLYSGRVVRHDDAGLLAWVAKGSRHWFPYMPDGRIMRDTPLPQWHGAAWVWTPWVAPRDMLTWQPPDTPYSVHFWFEEGKFTNYYVNFGGPAVVWREGELSGVDTEDWDLDMLVDPDLTWRYKDEEDLLIRSQWPDLYWVDDPARVYDVARTVVALVEAGAFPFDGTWRDFSPPATGPIVDTTLPPGWDRPRHH